MKGRKVSLGFYLVGAMLVLVLGTILTSGFFTFHQSREAVKVLAGDSIEDNISLVELRVQSLLKQTESAAEEVERILESRGINSRSEMTIQNVTSILPVLGDQLKSNEDLAYLSITLESTGEIGMVSRDGEGRVLFQRNTRTAPGIYWRKDFRQGIRGEEVVFDDRAWKVDSRTRPYFLSAKEAFDEAKLVAWTRAYTFIPSGNQEEELGVTCARPIRGEDGSLLGVITADITLSRLERFLNSIRIREVGYGFVIESQPDAKTETRVLAVPKVEVVRSRSDVQAKEILTEFRKASSTIDRTSVSLHTSESLMAEADHENLIVGYRQVQWPGVDWIVFAVVPESAYMGSLNQTYAAATRFAVALAFAGALLAFLMARRVALPLRALTEQAAQIGRLELVATTPAESSISEVNELGNAMDRMRNSLGSFARLVPRSYVQHLLQSNQEAVLSVEKRELTVLFVDLEGFTSQASRESLEVVVPRLNTFLQIVSDTVTEEDGTIDKFLGDEVMAFWGAPKDSEDREVRAVRAALLILERLPLGMRARVGIASGIVMVGNVGTRDRLNYTAIGDRINLASRLQGLNKVYGTELLTDEVTAAKLGGDFLVRAVDRVAVLGRELPESVSEIYLPPKADESEFMNWLQTANRAFKLYQEGRFADAERAYYEAILLRPDDSASAVMLERCQEYQRIPPGANWNGVYSLKSK